MRASLQRDLSWNIVCDISSNVFFLHFHCKMVDTGEIFLVGRFFYIRVYKHNCIFIVHSYHVTHVAQRSIRILEE